MCKLSMFEILQYLQRQFCYHAKWVQIRIDQNTPVTTYANFSIIKENLKVKESYVPVAVMITPDWLIFNWFIKLRQVIPWKLDIGKSPQVLLMVG
ncbi:MAG: hypothetical protein EZS28_013493 [Streblomastix strix]|uniref:Uncharacterized protein n=1 Tax=Streblomastix strix TaxID=222440 RepID=A0A5J4W9E7_9EUKA|nr:MAG: hypothetical protein EZS28_013493 [Streblomastix strix]